MKKLNEFVKSFALENNIDIISVATYSEKEGFTNYTIGKGISKNTALNVGEITHIVMGLLVASLIEKGKLSLSDKVSDILKKYPEGEVKVIDLLAHTAGYNAEEFNKTLPANPTEKDYLKCFYEFNSPDCGSGKKQCFFSPAYVLVAEIIETRSKKNIEQYAKEVLYSPLNIRNTTFDGKNTDKSKYKLTDNYKEEELKRSGMTMHNHLLSTAEDLVKMMSLLINDGKYLDKQVLSKAAVQTVKNVIAEEIALGNVGLFAVKSFRAKNCLSDLNSKGAYGFKSSTGGMIMIDEEYELVNVILAAKSNLDNDVYRGINSRLLSMV